MPIGPKVPGPTWSTIGTFEILNVDLEKKRIGVALVPEGSVRERSAVRSGAEIVPGARLKGKVERHERFGVFVFLAPGRTGLIPMSETGVDREEDVARTFPVGTEVEVVVLELTGSSSLSQGEEVTPCQA